MFNGGNFVMKRDVDVVHVVAIGNKSIKKFTVSYHDLDSEIRQIIDAPKIIMDTESNAQDIGDGRGIYISGVTIPIFGGPK